MGWYRIPLRYAPKIVSVDVVAFYQTAEFGEEKWSIRYAARVRGVEMVKRSDLFQEEIAHPRAQEEYYKLQLGPLEMLPRPITSRAWHRITFFYTSGEKLLDAREVRDWSVPPADRQTLWKALRDRSESFAAGKRRSGKDPLAGGVGFCWPNGWARNRKTAKRADYPAMIFIVTCRSRGPSNSVRKIPCHGPRRIFRAAMIRNSVAPTSEDWMCAGEFPSLWRWSGCGRSHLSVERQQDVSGDAGVPIFVEG